MKARYYAETNSLRELPEMEEPQEPHLRDYAWSDQYHDACAAYSRDFAIYHDHVASLREIPCHESCKSFKDQEVYEEGKDYSVQQPDINIYAQPGTKMVVLFIDGLPANGHDYQQREAAKYLKPDTLYELERSEVGGWSSEFYLKEFPGRAFNSVHFFSPVPVAYPVSLPKSEDELWKQVVDEIIEFVNEGQAMLKNKSIQGVNDFLVGRMKRLQQKYTITPR